MCLLFRILLKIGVWPPPHANYQFDSSISSLVPCQIIIISYIVKQVRKSKEASVWASATKDLPYLAEPQLQGGLRDQQEELLRSLDPLPNDAKRRPRSRVAP